MKSSTLKKIGIFLILFSLLLASVTIVKHGNVCKQAKEQYDQFINHSYINQDENIQSKENKISHLEDGVEIGCFLHYGNIGVIIFLFLGGISAILFSTKRRKYQE